MFDDPLSALDAEVGANVFKNCIKTLLHGKTRILVTHQLGVLPEVDRVVLMGTAEDGSSTILAQGSLNELLAKGYDLSKIVRSSEERENDMEVLKEKAELDHEAATRVEAEKKLPSVEPESSADFGVAIKVVTSDTKSSSDVMGGDGVASSVFAATVAATSAEDSTHDSGKCFDYNR